MKIRYLQEFKQVVQYFLYGICPALYGFDPTNMERALLPLLTTNYKLLSVVIDAT